MPGDLRARYRDLKCKTPHFSVSRFLSCLSLLISVQSATVLHAAGAAVG